MRKDRKRIAFKYQKRLRKKATKSEVEVKKILKDLGVRYDFQKIFYGKKRFVIVDFYLNDFNVVLEIDGESHFNQDALIYDDYRTQFLMNRCNVSEVIRYKNSEVLKEKERVEDELMKRFAFQQSDYYSRCFNETIN